MSPASQGALEVERYIGSCLISQGCRGGNKQEQPRAQQFGPVGTWAGGAPLISMAANPRRQQQQQQAEQQQQHGRVPLSRLAVHTQGAPLILSSARFHSGRAKLHGGGGCSVAAVANISGARCAAPQKPGRPATMAEAKKQQQHYHLQQGANVRPDAGKDTSGPNGVSVASIDSLSIASDESSGSNNSENSLPRIIKPRKRRKKDRKPPVLVSPLAEAKVEEQPPQVVPEQPQPQQQQLKSFSANSYPSESYFKGNHRRLANPARDYRGGSSVAQQDVVDTRQQQQPRNVGFPAHRHVQVKVLDDNRNVILPLPVCQAKAAGYLRYNEPVALACEEGPGLEGPLCQCHYCEPGALLWDAPQFHHHHHHHRFQQVPVFLATTGSFLCPEHLEFYDVAENPCLRRADGAAILRRSWSDPSSYFSDEIVAPSRDVGVIGDRGQSGEALNKGSRGSWRGDASTAAPSSPSHRSPSSPSGSSGPGSPSLPGALEVSTEIVTSPNGHRDLEIKFYSSALAPEEAKSAFAFPEEDGDIWSYHESKLQQDFRTLLQAEE